MDSNTTALVLNIVTITGTLSATALGAALTYHFTRKSNQNKVTREKIEEIYQLTTEVKLWIDVRVPNTGERSLVQQPQLNIQDHPNPINKLVMLTDLYAPSLGKDITELRNYIIDIREIKYGDDNLTGKEITDKIIQVSEGSDKTYEKVRISIKKLIKHQG